MNQTIISKLFALPVAVASLLLAYCASTPEGKETVALPPAQEVVLDSATTTTQAPLPDVSSVDWAGLALLIEEDRRIARQMEVDEARMLYGKCGEWHNLAIAVGWPEAEWPTLSYVMYRESRCHPDSHNKTDPMSGSRGLIQINGFWCRPNRYDSNGFLQSQGVLNVCDDLFNPEINLRAGLAIWLYGEGKHGCGWRGPWATPCGKYTSIQPHPTN